MFCFNCGIVLEKGIVVCPKCNTNQQLPPPVPPVFYPPMNSVPFFAWRSTVAGIMLMVAAMFCLFTAFFTYDYHVRYNDEYESLGFWLPMLFLQVWGFGMGLVSATLTFKRSNYLFAGVGYIIVVVAGALSFGGDFGPGLLIIFPAIPGLVLFTVAKREFDMPKDALPAYHIYPPTQPILPGHTPKAAPSPYDKMRELKKLNDEGIISEDEYESKRKQMLEKL